MGFWLVLAVLLALGLRRVFAGYPGPGLGCLAPREAALVASASEAMFPTGGEIPESGPDAGIPAFLDRYVATVPPQVRLLMRLLFFLVEHATLVFPGPAPRGWRRFSALDHEQRIAVLEGWRTSRLFPRRLVFTSLRAMLTMGYFADPAVLRRIGLAPFAVGTPVCEADLLYPRIGRPRSEIRYGPGDLTPPSDGTPLRLDGALHPDYREGAQ